MNWRYKGKMQVGKFKMPWEERANHATDLVFKILAENKVVLLHCRAGMHRAGTYGGSLVAIMYGMLWEKGMRVVISQRKRYTDWDKQVCFHIGEDLELQNFVTEYTHRDEWELRWAFFRREALCCECACSFDLISGFPSFRHAGEIRVPSSGVPSF